MFTVFSPTALNTGVRCTHFEHSRRTEWQNLFSNLICWSWTAFNSVRYMLASWDSVQSARTDHKDGKFAFQL